MSTQPIDSVVSPESQRPQSTATSSQPVHQVHILNSNRFPIDEKFHYPIHEKFQSPEAIKREKEKILKRRQIKLMHSYKEKDMEQKNKITNERPPTPLEGKKLIDSITAQDDNMPLEEQFDQLFRHLKKHRPHNDEQALKYRQNILNRIKDLDKQHTNTQSQEKSMNDVIQDLKRENEEQKTQILKQEEQLNALSTEVQDLTEKLIDKDEKVKELERKLRIESPAKLARKFENHFNLLKQFETEEHLIKIPTQKFQEDIQQLLQLLENQIEQIRDLNSELQRQQDYIENIHGKISREMDLKTELRNMLKEHESNIERFIEVRHAQASGQEFPQQKITTQTNELVSPVPLCKPSYATTLNSPAPQQSKSAILLTRKSTTNMSLFNIRDFINRELKTAVNLPKIYCTISKDKRTIIVRSNTDEDVNNIADKIQEHSNILDLVDLNLAGEKRKKIIILGIPKNITVEEIKEKLSEDLEYDIKANEHKELQRKSLKTYQLMLDLEDRLATRLLRQGRLLIGFLSCKIAQYAPIIRCSHCQIYGHTKERCRRKEICAYCMKNHETSTCPNKNDPRKHKCYNCYNYMNPDGRQYKFDHSANSSECNIFQNHFYNRHRVINYQQQRSRS